MKLRNGRMVMQAKDIPDEDFLLAMAGAYVLKAEEWGRMPLRVSRWDIHALLGESVPEKVVLAKAGALMRRGFIDGCVCGCRGDFEFVEAK